MERTDREYLHMVTGFCKGCELVTVVEYVTGQRTSEYVQLCGADPDTNPETVHSMRDCPIISEKLLHDVPAKCQECKHLYISQEAGGPEVQCAVDDCIHERRHTVDKLYLTEVAS